MSYLKVNLKSNKFDINDFIPEEGKIIYLKDSKAGRPIYIIGDGKTKLKDLQKLEVWIYDEKLYLVPSIEDKRIIFRIEDDE